MEEESRYPFYVISAGQVGNQLLQGLFWVEKKRGTLGKAWGAADASIGSRSKFQAGMHSDLCIAWSTAACIQNTAETQSDQTVHELLCYSEKEVVSAGPPARARGL